jgi:hypothetical protein
VEEVPAHGSVLRHLFYDLSGAEAASFKHASPTIPMFFSSVLSVPCDYGIHQEATVQITRYA